MTKNILILEGDHMWIKTNIYIYNYNYNFSEINDSNMIDVIVTGLARVTVMTGHTFFSTLHIYVYIML